MLHASRARQQLSISNCTVRDVLSSRPSQRVALCWSPRFAQSLSPAEYSPNLSGIIDWKSDRGRRHIVGVPLSTRERFASGGAMTTTIVVVNPYSRKLERYDIGGLTPEELQALPLDERICEEISTAIARCPPEKF